MKRSLLSAYVCSAKMSNFSDKGWWESSMRAVFCRWPDDPLRQAVEAEFARPDGVAVA